MTNVSVTVSFFGGTLVPGLPKSVTMDLAEPITVAALLDRLDQMINLPDLCAKLVQYYAILVDGTSIQHLQGWDTVVRPGAAVAVVAPMGGGGGV